jgi:hypothetical protein
MYLTENSCEDVNWIELAHDPVPRLVLIFVVYYQIVKKLVT